MDNFDYTEFFNRRSQVDMVDQFDAMLGFHDPHLDAYMEKTFRVINTLTTSRALEIMMPLTRSILITILFANNMHNANK